MESFTPITCVIPCRDWHIENALLARFTTLYDRPPAESTVEAVEIIQLSLMQNRRPSWDVTIDSLDRPTVSPSVRQLEGSYAHFWIKKGSVEWCGDTGRKLSV